MHKIVLFESGSRLEIAIQRNRRRHRVSGRQQGACLKWRPRVLLGQFLIRLSDQSLAVIQIGLFLSIGRQQHKQIGAIVRTGQTLAPILVALEQTAAVLERIVRD